MSRYLVTFDGISIHLGSKKQKSIVPVDPTKDTKLLADLKQLTKLYDKKTGSFLRRRIIQKNLQLPDFCFSGKNGEKVLIQFLRILRRKGYLKFPLKYNIKAPFVKKLTYLHYDISNLKELERFSRFYRIFAVIKLNRAK